MKNKDILIVDDDEFVCHSLREMLSYEGYLVDSSIDGIDALQKLKSNQYAIILSDIRMPGMDGIELLKEYKGKDSDAVVILITAHGHIDGAVEAIKLGAYDYITKPIDDLRLKLTIQRALEQKRLLASYQSLKKRVRPWELDDGIIFKDRQMIEVLDLVDMVADTMAMVLITGESGTGKSLLAKYIHRKSSRREGPFVELSCGSLSETLLESELFGHVRGSFTNAYRDKKGKFEEAHGGTIFLDDINSASLNLQAKLLRVLQEKVFERVGGNQTVKTDVRVITATNAPLNDEVERKRFREDLYHRINVVSLSIPPLRDRLADIEPLILHFIQRFNEVYNKQVKGIAKSALELCHFYPWPGNVRELEHVIERAIILNRGDFIIPEVLPPHLVEKVKSWKPGLDGLSLADALAAAEKQILFESLRQNNWNRQVTAQMLNISRTTLFNKMRRYEIDDPRRRSNSDAFGENYS
ncbi:MAG: sigma-54-dependent Fis family transcriptional regulator [Deltaproteobacteria bacterium]|nr:sigma-54-dependent Fis family transcriptional regulator [Deltaproteobacteria bacterium]MBW1953046.1 sigma-54-dependent Fis family transcriptional regulator [Deltaproteobacteria bacterium]MBW1985922.1 sigma-54-dependent Fis family transcriptional regulator [Deltaproteobacteria bacterium]MBW2133682.1 sigma-54-dependent Fis family transcriptional regulator [Deltaproteobacteria bacterium]